MSEPDDLFYRIGYALEEARSGVSGAKKLPSFEELSQRLPSRDDGGAGGKEPGDGPGKGLSTLLELGSGALAARLVGLWPARHEAGALGLLRAGAAGVGAAVLVRTVRPLIRPGPVETEVYDALTDGVTRGLLYAAVVEPRLPLPAVARGVLYGTAEYLVSPWGGLPRLLGKVAPHRRIPLLGSVLERGDVEEEGFVEHVAFAVAVAVLYEVTGGASGGSDGD